MELTDTWSLSDWLYHLENRYQQEIQLGLARISQVARLLQLNKPRAKVITVAGTNGKGSTIASLEAIYLAAGYRVGSYTSPHLEKYNERIRVARKTIFDQALCQAFRVIEAGRDNIPLTYFEMTTLAALWYFKQQKVDLILLEVGLGGRLDATNIIDSDLAIVTTIDLDHQEFLGTTKEQIAKEKAGILRKGCPFVFADENLPTSLLAQAKFLQCPSYILKQNYAYRLIEDTFEFRYEDQTIRFPRPKLHPQAIAAAIMASQLMMNQLPIVETHYRQGLSNASIPGRLQFIATKIPTLLDVSHNPQAVNFLGKYLNEHPPKGKIHAVFGALQDKAISELIKPMVKWVTFWYPAFLPTKRAALKMHYDSAFRAYYKKLPRYYSCPRNAYSTALQQAESDDLIVVYGSFYTVGEVMIALSDFSLAKGK